MNLSPVLSSNDALLAQLWMQFKQDDEQAFNQLIKLQYRLMHNYATRFTKNRELIKDCLQDLMAELWYRRKNLADTTHVTVYLLKAYRNHLIRKLRKDRNREGLLDDWDFLSDQLTDGQTIEKDTLHAEHCNRLRMAIDQLPTRQREVVYLKFYEGMTNKSIAEVMDIECQTVANFLYRAMANLKGELTGKSLV